MTILVVKLLKIVYNTNAFISVSNIANSSASDASVFFPSVTAFELLYKKSSEKKYSTNYTLTEFNVSTESTFNVKLK